MLKCCFVKCHRFFIKKYLQEEESGGSSTDMSICRSEPLFSSMRDSEMQNVLKNSLGGQDQGAAMRLPTQDSLIQDSLTDEDFNFGEKVTVNKNNYTLTYSGQGVIGSFIASMVSSAGIMLEPQGMIYMSIGPISDLNRLLDNC